MNALNRSSGSGGSSEINDLLSPATAVNDPRIEDGRRRGGEQSSFRGRLCTCAYGVAFIAIGMLVGGIVAGFAFPVICNRSASSSLGKVLCQPDMQCPVDTVNFGDVSRAVTSTEASEGMTFFPECSGQPHVNCNNGVIIDSVNYNPTTSEPTTSEPTTAELTTAELTTAEPTTAESTTAEPTTTAATMTAEPTTAESTTTEPTTTAATMTAEPTTIVITTAGAITTEPIVDKDESEFAISTQVSMPHLYDDYVSLKSAGIRSNSCGKSSVSFQSAVNLVKEKIDQMGIANYQQNYQRARDMFFPDNLGSVDNCFGLNSCNLYAFLPGNKESVVVVGTRLTSMQNCGSPGSNAPGVAGQLEAMRILNDSDRRGHSVLFVFWGEQGGIGGAKALLDNNALHTVMRNLKANDDSQEIDFYINMNSIAAINYDKKKPWEIGRKYLLDFVDREEKFGELKKHLKSFFEYKGEKIDEVSIGNLSEQKEFIDKGIPSVTLASGYGKDGEQAEACLIDYEEFKINTEALVYTLSKLTVAG
nr:M28 family peptidase [Endozoicomonas ascidiicola]